MFHSAKDQTFIKITSSKQLLEEELEGEEIKHLAHS